MQRSSGKFWGEVEADIVEEVGVSSANDGDVSLTGAEEAGDTVSTSPILYFQC
jgi:hypothetical protein